MPRTKKKQVSSGDSDSGPEDGHPPQKKSKDSSVPNTDATDHWILDKNRRVHINEFRGRKLIDIREYYEKNNETLPTKKGISLSIEQWKKLLKVADEINRAID